jgi:hypothetical protein
VSTRSVFFCHARFSPAVSARIAASSASGTAAIASASASPSGAFGGIFTVLRRSGGRAGGSTWPARTTIFATS